MTSVIEAQGLAHWYGQVVGVNDLTATVGPGITGLLGPNGAGKSTFMKLVTGQLRPNRGSIRVLGAAPFANGEVFRRLGFCPEHEALYDDMTCETFVAFTMRLHGMSRAAARQAAQTALGTVGLADVAERRLSGCSKGMRQRVKLAQAIAHAPELLVVDEPFTGLDPIARLHMLEVFRGLAARGVHVLVSSHVLHEIEALTQRILLIHRGRIVADGTVREVRDLLDAHPRKVRFRARDARRLGVLLFHLPGVVAVRVEPDGGGLMVETRDLAALRAGLPQVVSSARPGVSSMEELDSGLEAVFEYLVG